MHVVLCVTCTAANFAHALSILNQLFRLVYNWDLPTGKRQTARFEAAHRTPLKYNPTTLRHYLLFEQAWIVNGEIAGRHEHGRQDMTCFWRDMVSDIRVICLKAFAVIP